MLCPKCGSSMAMRKGPRGQFWGCSRFPACKGTVNIKSSPVVKVNQKTEPRDWSQNQLNIFQFVGSQNDNLVVDAVAGSGKTTTAVASLNYASRYRDTLS